MAKIRLAILKDCSYIGVAWIDKKAGGQAMRINIPRRKQEILKNILLNGIDFPEGVAKTAGKIAETRSGVIYKRPSLILPASAVEPEGQEQPAPKIITE